MKTIISLMAGAALSLASAAVAGTQDPVSDGVDAPPPAPRLPAVVQGVAPETDSQRQTEAEALGLWAKVHEVLSHPRCVNCHVPADNRPRWSGPNYVTANDPQGWRFHGMNIHGGESRIGIESIPCTTCHQAENSDKRHGPPGAEVWALAPVEMVWWDRSSSEICEQIKDPTRNGQRTLVEIADHVADDPLVAWGWTPGPGREPAPYSAAEVAAFLTAWSAAGAPCPSG